MLTRKHYKAIAEVLRQARGDYDGQQSPDEVITGIAQVLTVIFARDNPRFDSERFFDATFSKIDAPASGVSAPECGSPMI